MATFLMLSTVGPDGAATLTENPDRLKAVNAEVEAMGVRSWRSGRCSGPMTSPPCSMRRTSRPWPASRLVLGSCGTLKTLTLSAIPIDEYIENVLRPGKD